jgi:hypothetical protein
VVAFGVLIRPEPPQMVATVQIDSRAFQQAATQLSRSKASEAQRTALNAATASVQAAERKAMGRIFDRPTPYTLRGVQITKASRGGSIVTDVRIRAPGEKGTGTPQARPLHPQVYGGARPPKPFENLLRKRGILPPGYFAVPGKAAPLDQYGNVTGGFIQKVLSRLDARRDATKNSNARTLKRDVRRGDEIVAVLPGDNRKNRVAKTPGIWQRQGDRKFRPLFLFVRQPRYSIRFDFQQVAQTEFARVYPQAFISAWAAKL